MFMGCKTPLLISFLLCVFSWTWTKDIYLPDKVYRLPCKLKMACSTRKIADINLHFQTFSSFFFYSTTSKIFRTKYRRRQQQLQHNYTATTRETRSTQLVEIGSFS